MRVVLSDDSRLRGGEDAQFAGLQASRNGQTLIADDAQTALRLAQENPESGVVIRLHGEERLLNEVRLTGGRITEPDEVTRFLQAATVLNGVAAFTALVGYLPLSSVSYGIPGLLMLSGVLLTLAVLFCVHGLVPASRFVQSVLTKFSTTK